ncbi:hypothetical protein MVEN_01271000 [Mycena venus]|uniref:Uncharacterized protein n=1 Tax=Mycena venus TaxID=2733690 RepID=A0A8H6Y4B8_9AGAR|nr:hypothetical protein MVEN_01271000 [Mycena venus]
MLTFLRVAEPGSSTARPNLARQDTELLASYYQSPLADQGVNYSPHALDTRPTRPAHRRTLSGDSTSSSDYSSSGSTSDHSIEEAKPATRRASVPSEGGADRRRLAIVQMDPVREAESPTASSPSAVRSRRGFETRLEGLALVAPPDAAGNLHQYINPPGSAPPTWSLKTKSSRDVGIVGTASSSTSSSAPLQSPKMKLSVQIATESLLPPVFQEPHSSRASTPNTRASTPNSSATPSDARSLAPKRRSTDMSVHTPEIGQSKEIHVPVASPVVVDLGPAASLRVGHSTFDRRSPALQVVEPRPASPLPLSSYLHYQPGEILITVFFCQASMRPPVPYLPPPRATFSIDPLTPPPPRPPRLHSPPPRSPRRADLDAVNQPLQLAVSAVLSGSSGSSTPSSTSRSISPPRAADRVNSEESNDETLHRREGAFSPSVISTTPSTSPSDYSPTTARPGRTIDGLIPHVGEGSKSPVSVGSGGSSSSNKSNAPLSTMVPPGSRMESLREQPNEAEWTHISRDLTASPSSEGHVSQDHDRVSWESSSPPASVSHSQEGVTQTPSAKTRARTSLGAGLKRFASLPRTPSRSPSSRSRSLGRSGSTSTHNSTRSNGGSPAAQPAPLPPSSWNPNTTFPQSDLDPRQNQRQPMPRRRKIVSRNPPALSSADLVGKKSALERCSLYAQKINELYMHDCGLSEWMVEARFRGSSGPKAATLTQRTSGGGPQPRHVSHSSIKSEATFPIRGGGAMVATDLSTKPSDIAPAVPALPYPALSPRAMTMNLPSGSSTMPMPLRMLASAASSSSHSSNSSKSSGNLSFFSSLGRKASMSKPNKPVPMASFSISSSSSGGARLTKAPPVSMNNHAISNPRPVVIPNGATPAVPGGPRAPPNRGGDRALRTQSINISSPFSSNMADRDRSSASASMTAKRPSLFAPPSSSSAGSRSSESPSRSVGSGGRGSGGRGSGGRGSGTPDRDREFDRQVDKLSDLLPQAERDVLAGYLRRAGQDILAIGQYLEDEKNGVLRRD